MFAREKEQHCIQHLNYRYAHNVDRLLAEKMDEDLVKQTVRKHISFPEKSA